MNKTLHLTQSNFDEFVRRADQPILVDFWAEWCGPCKMLSPVLEEVAQQHAGNLVVAKVNIDENPDLAARYHVQSIPTLLYFVGGEVRAQTVGAVSKKSIAMQLAALPKLTPTA